MTKSIKLALVSILAAFGLTLAVVPATVNAQVDVNPNLCGGILLDPGQECGDIEGSDDQVKGLAETIIDVFSLIIGIVSVIVIIVAGLRYIVSGGESSNVQGAKNTILYAIIGLVIVLFAQTIVKFVVNQLSN